MHDSSVPMSRLLTVTLWFVTADLITGAWVSYLCGDDGLAHLLGYTACTMSAVAATSSVRCYAIRLSRLVRAAGGLTPPDSVRELHRVH